MLGCFRLGFFQFVVNHPDVHAENKHNAYDFKSLECLVEDKGITQKCVEEADVGEEGDKCRAVVLHGNCLTAVCNVVDRTRN